MRCAANHQKLARGSKCIPAVDLLLPVPCAAMPLVSPQLRQSDHNSPNIEAVLFHSG